MSADGGWARSTTTVGAVELQGLDAALSAQATVDRRQRIGIVAALVVLGGCLAYRPVPTCTALVAVCSVTYLVLMADRLYLFSRGVEHSPEIRISPDEAGTVPDEELPIYTILVPAYGEPSVIGRLIENLERIDYPPARLDVKLLLEADDEATIEAAYAALPARIPVEVLRVPPVGPRTKPKACNYGLQFARGAYTTIYDAEDVPDRLQLRRAVLAFRRAPAGVACLQAKLKYHNARQNLLTRWFSAEYDQWFGYILPGLMWSGAPIPLGGTSNHIATDFLRSIGGWDPYNVTEDADLGIRLERHRRSTAVLDSVTFEEANSDVINWIRQRSRWYKGYLQTFLVHMRHPVRLVKELGCGRAVRFVGLTAGTPVISVINSVFWGLTLLWEIGAPGFIRQIFPMYAFYPAIFSLVVGNTAMIYMGIVACRQDRSPHLLLACLIVPAYWVLMSVAAIKAFVQLVFQPTYWEKTVHGLDAPELAR